MLSRVERAKSFITSEPGKTHLLRDQQIVLSFQKLAHSRF